MRQRRICNAADTAAGARSIARQGRRRVYVERHATLFSIITNLLHFGMVVVGLDYGHAGQMTLDVITGGSPYGATTITGGDGSRLPNANGSRRSPLPGPKDCGDPKQAARLIDVVAYVRRRRLAKGGVSLSEIAVDCRLSSQ